MTSAQLATLGGQMHAALRATRDPELKIMLTLAHAQTVNLRKGTGGPGLFEMLMATLRNIARRAATSRS